ncbi:MAG: UDP-N-acetylmuramoyl-L-alanine--D-glutamate ligase [Desulfobulbus sp.]|jgi:UDP-N-acetylmuramoylalanine--D-glutamate ligase|uniref:UDP-N-acetylmuramoyl-L-alanine--D-glutamate ligase n=1 Tax=Desulfobulbus sp. TaxID=895 RepID=UPI00283F563A|nr:UDP-N-acetylmuramoyl-L-alanine--D-glutamate ligase [Desulfobulbus sp.]MDR2548834.1 UDP-N-acetylmuramoyl-L-alanine--D-glutamate ligase [Desulfobulbus sp.]
MQIRDGLQAAVIGLGAAGLSTVRYLVARGARVRVSDQRRLEQIEPATVAWLEEHGVSLEHGGHTEAFLAGAEAVIPGPGVPLELPVLQAAWEQGLPIWGELALAAGQYRVPVIAITGSNGKTTVTSLIGHLLRAANRKPFVGGNIGTPLLDYFADPGRYDSVVLELSSFQLDLAGSFRPNVGLLLNLSPDHLDRHGSFDAYAAAKMQLFAHQVAGDCAILGTDDPLAGATPIGKEVRRHTFGRGGECSARIVAGRVELRRDTDGAEHRVSFDLGPTRLHSSVNQLNAAAAVLAVAQLGCEPEAIARGLLSFEPPPHRMAEVATIDGVRFIDDSKATNIGALEAALGGCEAPVVLIAGGRDKGSDYTLLREVVGRRVKHLVLLGEAAGIMRAALETVVTTETVGSMAEAVHRAMAAAASGDLVLLAPGCASFDMFSGYAERGRVFAEQVLRLGRERTTNG